MSIEELLQQIEEFRERKARDHRPAWLKAFVRNAAELFEPLAHSGRVGFDCQVGEEGWIVSLYLGTTEIIGGPRDGQIDHVGFRINLAQLTKLFTNLERAEWYSVSNENDTRFHSATRSLLSVIGTVNDQHKVQLELLGEPPVYVEPGIKQNENNLSR